MTEVVDEHAERHTEAAEGRGRSCRQHGIGTHALDQPTQLASLCKWPEEVPRSRDSKFVPDVTGRLECRTSRDEDMELVIGANGMPTTK